MKKSFFFHNLDLVRFIAFIAVYIAHVPFTTEIPFFVYFKHMAGHLAVETFFTLSGFLITTILLFEYRVSNTISLLAFYARRLFRIFPLYFFILLVIIGVDYFFDDSRELYHQFCLYYFPFLANFDRIYNNYQTVNEFVGSAVLWSIGLEEQFYTVIPVFLRFSLKINKILPFLLLLYAGTLAYKFYAIKFISDHSFAFRAIEFSPFSAFDSILVGCILAYVVFQYEDLKKRIVNWLTIPKMLLITGLFSCIIYVDFALENIYFSKILFKEISNVYFALVLVFVSYHPFISQKTSNPIIRGMNYFGKVSFGLYLYHAIIIHYFFKLELNLALSAVICFGLSMLVAHLSYRYFEYPILKYKKRFTKVETRAV